MNTKPVSFVQLAREKTYDFRYKRGSWSESLRPTSSVDGHKATTNLTPSQNRSRLVPTKSAHNTTSTQSPTPNTKTKTQPKKVASDGQNKTQHATNKKTEVPHPANQQALTHSGPNPFQPTQNILPNNSAQSGFAAAQATPTQGLVATAPFLAATGGDGSTSFRESDKKSQEPQLAQEIITNLLRSPSPEWAKQALKAVHTGELSEIQYFSIAKELALRPDQASERVSILLLSQWPGKSSFLTFVEITQTKPEWRNKSELWHSYHNPTTIHSLLPILVQTENPQTLHWGLRLVYEFVTELPSGSRSTSSLTNPMRGQGWSRQSTGAIWGSELSPAQRQQWTQWLETISQRALQDPWQGWIQASLQALQMHKDLIAELPQE